MSRNRMPEHRIAEISYSRDYLECTCGAVMPAKPRDVNWRAHRAEHGLGTPSIGASIGKRTKARVPKLVLAAEAQLHRRLEVGAA